MAEREAFSDEVGNNFEGDFVRLAKTKPINQLVGLAGYLVGGHLKACFLNISPPAALMSWRN
jgi:hypothetical protein